MKQPLLFILLLSLFASCTQDDNQQQQQTIQTLSGKTMGTYYQVRYVGEEVENLPAAIDSLLEVLDFELSTYNAKSVISKLNQGQSLQDIVLLQSADHFIENFILATSIYQQTKGYFDPTVMPLVNYWGFGYDPEAVFQAVDSSVVDSLLIGVGFDKMKLKNETNQWRIDKQSSNMQIDFSAIAKGYGVDQLAFLLEKHQINNYLVDIGGEVVGKGHKPNKKPWRIGIATPLEDAAPSDYLAAVAVENAAIATSGNYRNFHEIDGVKYSHTINPFTGFPERSQLLSASILASDCATADAFATACMVAGLDNAYEMIDTMAALEGFFIFSDEAGHLKTKTTAGFPTPSDQNQ